MQPEAMNAMVASQWDNFLSLPFTASRMFEADLAVAAFVLWIAFFESISFFPGNERWRLDGQPAKHALRGFGRDLHKVRLVLDGCAHLSLEPLPCPRADGGARRHVPRIDRALPPLPPGHAPLRREAAARLAAAAHVLAHDHRGGAWHLPVRPALLPVPCLLPQAARRPVAPDAHAPPPVGGPGAGGAQFGRDGAGAPSSSSPLALARPAPLPPQPVRAAALTRAGARVACRARRTRTWTRGSRCRSTSWCRTSRRGASSTRSRAPCTT